MPHSTYRRLPPVDLGLLRSEEMQRAVNSVIDRLVARRTGAARRIRRFAEAARQGDSPSTRAADTTWRQFRWADDALRRLLPKCLAVWPGFVIPALGGRPSVTDIRDMRGSSSLEDLRRLIEWASESDGWLQEIAARRALQVGWINGQKVLPGLVRPGKYLMYVYCGHRWNEHGIAEGPKAPHCDLCKAGDENPDAPNYGAAAYYVMPVHDPAGWSHANRAFNHKFNRRLPPGTKLADLQRWRTAQREVAARGYLAAPVEGVLVIRPVEAAA